MRAATALVALAFTVGCGSGEASEPSADVGSRGLPAGNGDIVYTHHIRISQLFFADADGSKPAFSWKSAPPLKTRVAQAERMRRNGFTPEFGGGDPAWSPDGTRIAFVRADPRWGLPLGLVVVRADGSGSSLLVPGRIGDPAWSPSGDSIAFSMAPKASPARSAIYVRGAGGHVRRLTDSAGYGHPTWSPDGKYLAFHEIPPRWELWGSKGAQPTILRMEVATNDVERLSTGMSPEWSPLGEQIVFEYLEDPSESFNPDVYVMDTNGREVRRLTQAPADGWDASWSPDGRQIVFMSSRREGLPELWVMRADGSEPHPLKTEVDEFCSCSDPDWQPQPGR